MEQVQIHRENCIYTSCYCEENVWKLCEKIKIEYSHIDLSLYFVVFISNADKKIPLWCQKSSDNPPSQPVVWDYHVILIQANGKDSLVFDLDSILSFPCDLHEYAVKALRSEENMKNSFCRMFRVVPALRYLETFASDRSHMIAPDGEWCSPPPQYPPITSQDCVMNLFDFVSMDPSNPPGTVLDLNDFLKHFHCEI